MLKSVRVCFFDFPFRFFFEIVFNHAMGFIGPFMNTIY